MVLFGIVQVKRRELLEDGVLTEFEQDSGPEFRYDIAQIDCLGCHTRVFIKDDDQHQLEQIIDLLRRHYKQLTGTDPLAPEGSSVC